MMFRREGGFFFFDGDELHPAPRRHGHRRAGRTVAVTAATRHHLTGAFKADARRVLLYAFAFISGTARTGKNRCLRHVCFPRRRPIVPPSPPPPPPTAELYRPGTAAERGVPSATVAPRPRVCAPAPGRRVAERFARPSYWYGIARMVYSPANRQGEILSASSSYFPDDSTRRIMSCNLAGPVRRRLFAGPLSTLRPVFHVCNGVKRFRTKASKGPFANIFFFIVPCDRRPMKCFFIRTARRRVVTFRNQNVSNSPDVSKPVAPWNHATTYLVFCARLEFVCVLYRPFYAEIKKK